MQTYDIEKTLQQYHQRKAEQEAENQKFQQQQAEEKAKTTAYYAALKAKKHPTRTRREHTCSNCNNIIPIGTMIQSPELIIVAGSSKIGGNGHFESKYFCEKCKPVTQKEINWHKPHTFAVLTESEMVNLYNQGFSTRDIAKIAKNESNTVYSILKENNVIIRTQSEGEQLFWKSPKGKERVTILKLRCAELNPNWKIEPKTKKAGNFRAIRWFKAPEGKERHHIDGDPLNNDPSNIAFVSRKEHMIADGRMKQRDAHGHFCSPLEADK